jgi:hypothetical protein
LLKRLFIALTHEDVRKTAIKRFSSDMGKELEIWTTVEKRQIQESSSDDQAFKEAEKLVRKKRYSEALLIYKKIYEQRNSFTAGYNMVLMLEAKHQFLEALTVLEDLEKRISSNAFSIALVKNEIAALNRIINELEELPH